MALSIVSTRRTDRIGDMRRMEDGTSGAEVTDLQELCDFRGKKHKISANNRKKRDVSPCKESSSLNFPLSLLFLTDNPRPPKTT